MEAENKKQKMTCTLPSAFYEDIVMGSQCTPLIELCTERKRIRTMHDEKQMTDAEYINKMTELIESINNITIEPKPKLVRSQNNI